VPSRIAVHSILALLSLFAISSHAEVRLYETRAWSRALNLPAGQQVWSFRSSHQITQNRFSGHGEVQPLGRPYARAVTWGQLVRSSQKNEMSAELVEMMKGRRQEDVAATATYELTREELSFGTDWAYGLTQSWMIGFQLPVHYRRTHVHTNVSLTPDLAASVAQQKSSFHSAKVNEQIKELANQELVDSGYDNVPDERSAWEMGDVSLLSQTSVVQRYSWQWSLQQVVRVPTARNPSLGDYFQTSNDEGNIDLGLTSLVDYRRRRWLFGSRLGYVVQLPDTVRQRVPSRNGNRIDPKVRRDLGDWGWAALSSEYHVSRAVDLNLEYSYLRKGHDNYDGSSPEGVDYSVLSENTDQDLHETRLGVTYRLGEDSVHHGLEQKWLASLGYTYPWMGRNSIDASRTSLELTSYF
jgi:hypothetical protein